MKTFIQLKDGIGWASVNTAGEIQDAIEIEFGTENLYLKKKYENGVWSDPPLIKWAEVNESGVIIEMKSTYFTSEITGPIMTLDTTAESKWIDGAWINSKVTPPIE